MIDERWHNKSAMINVDRQCYFIKKLGKHS